MILWYLSCHSASVLPSSFRIATAGETEDAIYLFVYEARHRDGLIHIIHPTHTFNYPTVTPKLTLSSLSTRRGIIRFYASYKSLWSVKSLLRYKYIMVLLLSYFFNPPSHKLAFCLRTPYELCMVLDGTVFHYKAFSFIHISRISLPRHKRIKD